VTRHVLLVDDDEAIRMVARLGLERVGGWSVATAAGSDEALDAVDDRWPDAVLLDVMMPGLDGPHTLARLRDLDGGEDLPVVFLTAKMQPDEVARLRGLGVAGVLGKPFDPMTLPGQVADVLGWSGPAPAEPPPGGVTGSSQEG
jgi:CheY-like chemotaxis protein